MQSTLQAPHYPTTTPSRRDDFTPSEASVTLARNGLREAINEKCRECICDQHAGSNWREQVAACTSYNCPLYSARPLPRQRGGSQ